MYKKNTLCALRDRRRLLRRDRTSWYRRATVVSRLSRRVGGGPTHTAVYAYKNKMERPNTHARVYTILFYYNNYDFRFSSFPLRSGGKGSARRGQSIGDLLSDAHGTYIHFFNYRCRSVRAPGTARDPRVRVSTLPARSYAVFPSIFYARRAILCLFIFHLFF